MKQRIVPIVSILIGILAFALTSQYLNGKRRELELEKARLYAGTRKITVVVAKVDIPGQTAIKAGDIAGLDIPESTASDRVIPADQYLMIIGRKTLFPVKALKPVLWSDLEGGGPADQGLSAIVTPGMRAVSLAVGGADAVSGMIQPNDHIDVLGTFSLPSTNAPGQMESVTLTVLQDVTVLAVGQKMANRMGSDRAAAASGGTRAVTVEVTPREAELLVFVQQVRGGVSLTLRNQGDVSFEKDLPEVNFGHIESKLPEFNLDRQKNIRHKKNL